MNVDPDGSTTFEGAEDAGDAGAGGAETMDEEMMEEVVAGIDPAIYLLVAFVVGALLYFLYSRKSRSDEDDYFSSYEKVSIVGTQNSHWNRTLFVRGMERVWCFKTAVFRIANIPRPICELILTFLVVFVACSSILNFLPR